MSDDHSIIADEIAVHDLDKQINQKVISAGATFLGVLVTAFAGAIYKEKIAEFFENAQAVKSVLEYGPGPLVAGAGALFVSQLNQTFKMEKQQDILLGKNQDAEKKDAPSIS